MAVEMHVFSHWNKQVSLHVKLRKAFPHQPGRPQPANGPVHLQSSVREILMQGAADTWEVAEGEERGRGGEIINRSTSTEVFRRLHQKILFQIKDRNKENY